MSTILDTGITLIIFLQSLGDGFITIMKGFTFLGDEEFYLLIFPLLYWCIDNTLGLRMGIILMVSSTINTYFKWSFHLPRPFWYSTEVSAFVSGTSFGVPSGHSQNAVAVWGLLAASLRKPWAWTMAFLLIFFVGLSRMALGVHFYLDVLLGWLIGIIVLVLYLRFESSIANWFQKKNQPAQLTILFIGAIGVLALGSLILALVGGWQIPPEWIENAAAAFPGEEEIQPFSMSGLVTNAAVLFGLVSGATFMKTQGGFDMQSPIWKLFLRYVVGLIGVLAIWAGLDMVFPDGHDLVAYAFRFIRYGLAGFWISFGAPWIFVKTGLAEPVKK